MATISRYKGILPFNFQHTGSLEISRCSMKKETLQLVLDWLAAHTPQLVQLLGALVPLVALGVAGLAVYSIVRVHAGGRKK